MYVVLDVRDVSASARVPILLREPEVNYVHERRVRASAHDEVGRLDIAVDKVLLVNVLDPGNLVHSISVSILPNISEDSPGPMGIRHRAAHTRLPQ